MPKGGPLSCLRRPQVAAYARFVRLLSQVAATSLQPNEISSLRAFRRAALQIRNASPIATGATIGIEAITNPGVGPSARFRLLEEEPFRSLAMSVRLVYMNEEPAQFGKVCNILHRTGDATIQRLVADARARFKAVVQGNYIQFGLHGPYEGQVVGPQEVLEAWLYGIAFHQDNDRQWLVDELNKYQGGAAFPFAVNMITLQLAGVTMDLDDVVADFLGEPRIARIGPTPSGSAA